MTATRILVVSVALGALACSGASSAEIADPVSTSTVSTDPTLPSGSATATAPAPSAEPEPEPPADPGAVPPDEEPGCIAEVESNDNPGRANALLTCVTGVLDGRDDVDYFRTVVPEGARRMRIDHVENGGRVQYRVTEENVFLGLDFAFTDENPEIRVRPGTTLLVRVSFPRNGKDAPRSYELSVAYE